MTPTEIRAARHKLGLTQRELEHELGLNGSDGRTVRKWEAKRNPREISGPCAKLIGIFLKEQG